LYGPHLPQTAPFPILGYQRWHCHLCLGPNFSENSWCPVLINDPLTIAELNACPVLEFTSAYMLQQVTLKQSWAPRTSEVDLFGLHSQLTAISILFTAAGEPGII
jgi:hypothetical protein